MHYQLIFSRTDAFSMKFMCKEHIIRSADQAAVEIDLCNRVDSLKPQKRARSIPRERKSPHIPEMAVFQLLQFQGIRSKKRILQQPCGLQIQLKIAGNAAIQLLKACSIQHSLRAKRLGISPHLAVLRNIQRPYSVQ